MNYKRCSFLWLLRSLLASLAPQLGTFVQGIDDTAVHTGLTYEEDERLESLLKISEKKGELGKDVSNFVTW